MEIYTTTLMILSLFGILTLILSIYIFIVVPTKMSAMFRAILIGNFLTSNFLQIFCSLGTMPSILLPCFALYTNGLMNYTGMSTIVQVHITGVIFSFSGWLVVFICLLRALAVSVYLTEQQKTQITFAYIIFSLLNLFPLAAMGDKLRFSGDDKLSCSEMFNSQPPPELFMSETVVVSVKDGSDLVFYLGYCICTISVFSMIEIVSTVCLIWSLRMHRTQSSSSKALESQHKLTLGVLKLAFFQSMGTTVPPIAVMFCIMNAIPSRTASEILMILLVINVNIACIILIRLIPAYKERLSKICLSIFPVELIKRMTTLKPQTVSVQSSVVQSTSSS